MDDPHWRKTLRGDLLARGAPSRYVERFLEELLDHYHDLMEEESMDAQSATEPTVRLGTPADLASFAAAEYRKISFARRRPFLTFVLAPVPALALSLVISLLLCWGIVSASGVGAELDRQPTIATMSTLCRFELEAVAGCCRFLPFILTVVLFCTLSQRSGIGLRWTSVTCSILALVALCYSVTLTLPTEPGKGSLQFGLGMLPFGQQLLQGLATLGVGALCVFIPKLRMRPAV